MAKKVFKTPNYSSKLLKHDENILKINNDIYNVPRGTLIIIKFLNN